MNIAGLNGSIKANIGVASSFYQKNGLGKFTDKNMLDTILLDRPQQYDRIIKLFTQGRLYSSDFLDLVMSNATPFYVKEPNGQFSYEIHKYSDLPKVVINLSDTNMRTGIDGTEFSLVFDKRVFVINDRITAHRREQEVQLQVVREPERYQNFWKYTFLAISEFNDGFVPQKFLQPGTEYIKLDNGIGEYTTELTSIGMIDGNMTVVTEGLEEYGIEHTMTEYAKLKKLKYDQYGKPLDITYYSVATTNDQGQKVNLMTWEPTIQSLMRSEMMKMKANKLFWGRPGMGKDEKGRPIKFYSGLWRQMHQGNVIHFDQGTASINLFRYALDNLFHNRVAIADRKAKIYTNRTGMQLISRLVRQEATSQGLVYNADKFVTGPDNLNLGFMMDFSWFHTKETGKVEFVELEQLNQADTFLEQSKSKRVPPIFIILDISGEGHMGMRELKLEGRPNMLSAYIPGVTSFNGVDSVLSASRNPYQTWMMKDFTGLFLEDPTRTVIIKEIPQI